MDIETMTGLLSKATMGALFLGAIYHSSLYYFRKNDLLGLYAIYLWSCFIYMAFRVYSGGQVQTNYQHFVINSCLLVVTFHLYFYFFVVKVFELTRQKTSLPALVYKSTFIISGAYFIAMLISYFVAGDVAGKAKLLTDILSGYYVVSSVVVIAAASKKLKSGVEFYIFLGAILLLIFNLAGFMSQFAHKNIMQTHFLNFICLGIFSEIVLFSTAVGLRMKEELMAQVNAEKNILHQQTLLLESENQKNIEVLKAKISERRQISMDMHDELSNSLVGLKFFVSSFKRNASTEPEKEMAAKIEEEVIAVYQQARVFMHDLHAGTNQQWFDYIDFLNTLPKKFSDSSLTIDVDIKENDLKLFFTRTTENYLYLITKECLSNIMKYSQASKVSISTNIDRQVLYLSIKDNGIGIANNKEAGLGLKSMQDRVNELNGNFNIESTAAGTSVNLSIPAQTA